MDKEELLGILILSLSLVSWIGSDFFKIQFMTPISSFFAGAFTTYVIQQRLAKESESRRIRRAHALTMRDKIYGPIYRDLSIILEDMKNPKPWAKLYLENLKEASDHYLFRVVDEELRVRILETIDDSKKYDSIRRAKTTMLRDAIREKVKETHKVDASGDNPVWLHLYIGKNAVELTSMNECLLQQVPPSNFVNSGRSKWGKHVLVSPGVGGKPVTLEDLETLYYQILEGVTKDRVWSDELEQRNRLVANLEYLLGSLESFVKLE